LAGPGWRGGGAAALADGVEDLLEPGAPGGQDRAPSDDRADIDENGVRDQCRELELLERIARLEDDDLRAERQGGLDRGWITCRPERCLDTDLRTKVLRDTFSEQCVLVEDHNRVLDFTCHRMPFPRWRVIPTTLDGSHPGVA